MKTETYTLLVDAIDHTNYEKAEFFIGNVRISRLNINRSEKKFSQPQIAFTIDHVQKIFFDGSIIDGHRTALCIGGSKGQPNYFKSWDVITCDGQPVRFVGNLNQEGRARFAEIIRACDGPGIDNMARLIAIAKGR